MAGYEELKSLKEELCMKRIEVSKQNKSKPWTIEDLIEILSSLKNGKSRDPYGLVNEIFKPGVSGIDFQRSFLEMGNKIRDQIYIPEFIEYSDIVSIYKGKGEKNGFEQQSRDLYCEHLLQHHHKTGVQGQI